MPFIGIALIIAAAIGGGTAWAAEQALPGQPLWSVKVNVDEKLASMLAANDEQRAELDVADIKTRVNEAQQLQAQGDLSEQAQDDIAANLDAHAADAAQSIAAMQESGNTAGAATAAADFQAAMAAGAANLGQASISGTSSANASVATALIDDVHATLDEASALSADASAAVK